MCAIGPPKQVNPSVPKAISTSSAALVGVDLACGPWPVPTLIIDLQGRTLSNVSSTKKPDAGVASHEPPERDDQSPESGCHQSAGCTWADGWCCRCDDSARPCDGSGDTEKGRNAAGLGVRQSIEP